MFSLLKSLFRNTGPAASARPSAAAPRREFIAFVTPIPAPHFLEAGQTLASEQASMRLRVGIPARELAKRFPVCLVPVDYALGDPTLARLGRVRAISIGKHPVSFFLGERERAAAFVAWIESAASKQRIIVDFSDDLAAAAEMFSEPVLVDIQKRLLAACPASVPTLALKERLMPDARHGISVIEDPYESEGPGEPRFAPGANLRLAWFGVFGEPLRPFIEHQLGDIARRLASGPVELAFVTYAAQAPLVREMAARLRELNPQFAVRHVPWSVEATAQELARTDIVVLPQDAGSDWGRVKSHNRLVEAIRAGRLAVASPIPAYLELRDYAWVDGDLAAGIEWALAHPEEARSRVAEGQVHVSERFSPARIAESWAQALGI